MRRERAATRQACGEEAGRQRGVRCGGGRLTSERAGHRLEAAEAPAHGDVRWVRWHV